MNRQQLAHLLRASAQIAGDKEILVIGSQAILGSFDEDDLPAPATASREVDIAFLDDPDGHKADLVDGAIGELSPFDEQFGYYAQGVAVTTAVLPTGWERRLVTWQNQSTGQAQAVFLEPHDLALAKLAVPGQGPSLRGRPPRRQPAQHQHSPGQARRPPSRPIGPRPNRRVSPPQVDLGPHTLRQVFVQFID